MAEIDSSPPAEDNYLEGDEEQEDNLDDIVVTGEKKAWAQPVEDIEDEDEDYSDDTDEYEEEGEEEGVGGGVEKNHVNYQDGGAAAEEEDESEESDVYDVDDDDDEDVDVSGAHSESHYAH